MGFRFCVTMQTTQSSVILDYECSFKNKKKKKKKKKKKHSINIHLSV